MKNTTYVELIRVSTTINRQSLSPEFQKEINQKFIDTYGGSIVASFVEEFSGAKMNREVFDKAVQVAIDTNSVLLVAKLARLSRAGMSIIGYLEDQKVNYIEAVSPHDSNFVKGIKLLQAKEENDERKDNIRRGLGQIKKNIKNNGFHISKSGNKITSLGNPQNLTEESRIKSRESRRKKALQNPNNLRAKAMVELLVEKGMSYREMANYLNKKKFKTSTGKEFKAMSVSNLMALYDINKKQISK